MWLNLETIGQSDTAAVSLATRSESLILRVQYDPKCSLA